MRRTEMSVPVRAAFDRGILYAGVKMFEYGRGVSHDGLLLSDRGVTALGWDPFRSPDVPLPKVDVVNLDASVYSNIKDIENRNDVLRRAYKLAQRTLIVSGKLNDDPMAMVGSRKYKDGYIMKNNVFQKFHTKRTLSEWIKNTLGITPEYVGELFFFVQKEK